MGFRPPPELVQRAQDVASGRVAAAQLRPAATLVMLRDSDRGPEVFMMRRRRGMAFASGMLVFPGGAVEDRDATLPQSCWIESDVTALATAFGASEEQTRQHVVALVREVAEETGVLLARPNGDRPVPVLPPERRAALAAAETSLTEVLRAACARLDPQLLRPWARWVTPRFERRRFDAWFFAATLPEGQHSVFDEGEAESSLWVTPEEIGRLHDQGEAAMLPPTRHTIQTLTGASSSAALLASPPEFDRIAPGWEIRDGQFRLLLPGDPAYPGTDPDEGT